MLWVSGETPPLGARGSKLVKTPNKSQFFQSALRRIFMKNFRNVEEYTLIIFRGHLAPQIASQPATGALKTYVTHKIQLPLTFKFLRQTFYTIGPLISIQHQLSFHFMCNANVPRRFQSVTMLYSNFEMNYMAIWIVSIFAI